MTPYIFGCHLDTVGFEVTSVLAYSHVRQLETILSQVSIDPVICQLYIRHISLKMAKIISKEIASKIFMCTA